MRDTPRHLELALLMARAARELLSRLPEAAGVPLEIVAADGVMSTCYRPPRPAARRRHHVLQFGSRMAALQLDAPLGVDTSGREMRRHGWDHRYGDTPRARMACIVAHEVAHLVDHLGNGHAERRSHGRSYRRELVRLHETGEVEALIAWMRAADPDPRLDRRVVAAPRSPRTAPRPRRSRPACANLVSGDVVTFTDDRGLPRRGKVLRVNRRTVSVREDGQAPGHWWRVPPGRLRKA